MLRILGRISSINVRKVLWTAAEAGLDFEHDAAWAATRDTDSAEFLALNPNGLVPVLLSEEGALCGRRLHAGRRGARPLLAAMVADAIARPETPALLAYRARLQIRPAAKECIDPETP